MTKESAIDFPGNCRLHVALTVSDLEASKRFYELLLCEPRGKEGHLLNGVSVVLDPGERLAIVGPTGSGKTLFLRALALLDPIDAGEVLWRGTDCGVAAGDPTGAERAAAGRTHGCARRRNHAPDRTTGTWLVRRSRRRTCFDLGQP